MPEQWTILKILEWTQQRLAKAGEENPRLAAQMLCAEATGLARIELYAYFDKPLEERERALLRQMIQRRLEGEPLQYIIGKAGFWKQELIARAPVLIPRPETESLVELVLAYASERSALQILEVGTGSGAIALALAAELADSELTATDCVAEAVALARENAQLLGLAAERLRIMQDDLASALLANAGFQGYFDVVVSNPPYVPTAEYEQLPLEIRGFESRLALDGGPDGLDVFRRLVRQAESLLKPGGLLAVELHEDNVARAAAILSSRPFYDVEIHPDLNSRPRFLIAKKDENEY